MWCVPNNSSQSTPEQILLNPQPWSKAPLSICPPANQSLGGLAMQAVTENCQRKTQNTGGVSGVTDPATTYLHITLCV